MRVHAGGAEQLPAAVVECPAKRKRRLALRQAGAGQYQLADAGCRGALDHAGRIMAERRVGEVDANVDQLHLCSSIVAAMAADWFHPSAELAWAIRL